MDGPGELFLQTFLKLHTNVHFFELLSIEDQANTCTGNKCGNTVFTSGMLRIKRWVWSPETWVICFGYFVESHNNQVERTTRELRYLGPK